MGNDESPINNVAKFPNVPWPVIGHKELKDVFLKGQGIAVFLFAKFFEKHLAEEGNVWAAFTQSAGMDREDVDTVVEIFTELAVCYGNLGIDLLSVEFTVGHFYSRDSSRYFYKTIFHILLDLSITIMQK
jgi:hypothetical protein